jgi:protein-tyrosine phosphatase
MMRIVFVCHGNICRSPMAEWIFKDLAKKAGREAEFEVGSAAISYEEQGNPMYPPTKKVLRDKGIPFGEHHAHRITREEYANADIVVIMDESNRRYLERIMPESIGDSKVRMMLPGRVVADPWYDGQHERAYEEILQGCKLLLQELSV